MLIPLAPAVQHYAWGDPDVVPELFGLPRDGRPYAEAWLGAHPLAPSTAFSGHHTTPLDRVIDDEPEALLGPGVHGRWGRLPFLLKILAAAQPLSIQVHPSKAQAEAGFAREEAAGIPLDAPSRCYKDASDKPELLVALRPFHALAGFRPPEAIRAALERVPELARLLPRYAGSASLRELVSAYFELPAQKLAPAQRAILERLAVEDEASPFGPERPEHWLLRAERAAVLGGPGDRGLLFVFLLELVRLEPGQGLFLPAGVLHAYLCGAGIEVMASSDNVLRAGLTPKHVDCAELVQVVDFEHRALSVLEAPAPERGVRRYRTPASEFELELLELAPGSAPPPAKARGPELLLALEAVEGGAPVVRAGSEPMPLERGEACLVTDGTSYELTAAAPARLCRVRVP